MVVPYHHIGHLHALQLEFQLSNTYVVIVIIIMINNNNNIIMDSGYLMHSQRA